MKRGDIHKFLLKCVFGCILIAGATLMIYAQAHDNNLRQQLYHEWNDPQDTGLDHVYAWNGVPHISMAVAETAVPRLVFTEYTRSGQSGLTPRIFYNGNKRPPTRMVCIESKCEERDGQGFFKTIGMTFNQTVFVDSDNGPIITILPKGFVVPHTAVIEIISNEYVPVNILIVISGFLLICCLLACLGVIFLGGLIATTIIIDRLAWWIDDLVTSFFNFSPIFQCAHLHN